MDGSFYSKSKIWLLAIRPKTLPAAVSPVIVGVVMAFNSGRFHFAPAVACLAAAILLQIGSNLANDVFDYEKGADQGKRFGPTRVTQAGMLTPQEVKSGLVIVFGISAIIGIYLTLIAGWPVLFLGISAIISAIAYTGGPFPLGYHGLGDLFVFVFFGLAAVTGTFYIQVSSVTPTVWWMAVAMGLLTVAILVVNNLRDIECDSYANKRTLAVRFGKQFSRLEYVICIFGAYIVPVMLWWGGKLPLLSLIVLITIPISLKLLREIYTFKGSALNKTLAGTGRLELFYALCFAIGLIVNTYII